MAEGFNEWGDYGAEEEWQNRSTIRKIFSFRSLKTALKWVGYLFIIVVFGILAYRLFTGLGVPSDTKKLVWTDRLTEVYDNGTLTVYEQEISDTFDTDGAFGIFAFKYIPELDEVQLTVRYNASTVKLLKEVYDNNITPDDFPFLFYLRDNNGNVYKNYTYTYYTKGLYTYVRLVYDNVDLFSSSTEPAENPCMNIDDKYSAYVDRGINKPTNITSNIEHLYLDFLYEDDVDYDGEVWANPLTVYTASTELTKYNFSKDKPVSTTLYHHTDDTN